MTVQTQPSIHRTAGASPDVMREDRARPSSGGEDATPHVAAAEGPLHQCAATPGAAIIVGVRVIGTPTTRSTADRRFNFHMGD